MYIHPFILIFHRSSVLLRRREDMTLLDHSAGVTKKSTYKDEIVVYMYSLTHRTKTPIFASEMRTTLMDTPYLYT